MFQNEVLLEILNRKRENKLAHAYLIETNNIERALKDLKDLIKTLNCPEEYKTNCSTCNLCNLINKNNLPSLKIIEPDGTSIKKQQIEDLKIDFGTMPIYSTYNTYIIKYADKLNASSANSMLKFVEEPTSGILGFFLTTSKDSMMDTIKSRCQTLVLNYEVKKLTDKLEIDEETYEKYKRTIINYLDKLYSTDYINNKILILNNYPERKEVIIFLKFLFNIYHNYFLKILGKQFEEELTNIYQVTDSLDLINKKLQILTTILNEMSYNVNIELILDKLVIEMRGTHE